jgi:hypothetical protein
MASTYLTRTQANFGTATNSKKCTISFWVKRSSLTVQQAVMGVETTPAGGVNEARFILRGDDTFEFYDYQSGYTFRYITTRKFRDTSAWYNFVIKIDTSQANVTHRCRLYVNGQEETSFATESNPAQNQDTFLNSGNYVQIGRQSTGNSYLNGLLSHYHFIDGEDRGPEYFGETDSTTGVWKIKTEATGVNYGTNGFFILKDGNSVTDQSGEGNNFTVAGGTLTKTEDCPSNVFATGNLLNVNADGVGTFSNGNNTIKVASSTGSQFGSSSTLGMITGKFYCELKIVTVDSCLIGVTPSPLGDARNDKSPSGANGSLAVGCLVGSGNKYVSDNGSTYGAATSVGGIMMIALDLDNLKVYFGSGGQWSNGSGSWNQSGLTSGAAISITAVASTAEGAYFFAFGDGGGSEKAKVAWNFGNGYFETTAVSSAGTNASGIGIFEYDVPAGFTALSTKGLNE